MGNVEGWLERTGFIPDSDALNAEASRLRVLAVEALLGGRRCDEAERIVVRLDAERPRFAARLDELRGRHREAAAAYAVLGLPADALRNWRAAGCWEEAGELASGSERQLVEWLRALSDILATRPDGTALTAGERARLEQAWRRATAGPDR